jgi:hypothetical protein
MSSKLMNTEEVVRYLDIHEKHVDQLLKTGKITCRKNRKLHF